MDAARFSTGGATLPQEVLAVLPPDPCSQLELAYRITCFAHNQRVLRLETEGKQLRDALAQRDSEVANTRHRLKTMEQEVQAYREKSSKDAREKHKLESEKAALIDSVKKLNKEVSRLEGFKRNLLKSIRDDEDQAEMLPSTPSGHMMYDPNADRLVSNILASAQHTSPTSSAGLAPMMPINLPTPISTSHNNSWMPSGISSPLQPAPISTGLMSGGLPVSRLSTPPLPADLPATVNYAPPSVSGLAPSISGVSPLPRIDGKEFFRQARAHLSYEQFSQFLQNIKELNHGRQTRDETLKKARSTFGVANSELYSSFETLLNRHLP
ncbi:hypothetical protein BSKO_01824 [Bryopsis sp. KO-2023]|nr:hypothetical protein BSKO_01824 [Bryopsis sp. KO-2023]